MFRNEMQRMQTKYKILWFVVDLYHRERYFFICDLTQIVKKPGVKSRRGVAKGRDFAETSLPRFPLFVTESTC